MSAGAVFCAVLLLVALVALVVFLALRTGAAREQARQMKEQNDDVLEASAVRDRLRRDSDFASRVRARFTR